MVQSANNSKNAMMGTPPTTMDALARASSRLVAMASFGRTLPRGSRALRTATMVTARTAVMGATPLAYGMMSAAMVTLRTSLRRAMTASPIHVGTAMRRAQEMAVDILAAMVSVVRNMRSVMTATIALRSVSTAA